MEETRWESQNFSAVVAPQEEEEEEEEYWSMKFIETIWSCPFARSQGK